jgi:aminoglycoside phosphotransferase (APT) family kinase protein
LASQTQSTEPVQAGGAVFLPPALAAPFDRSALARYLTDRGHAFDPAQPIRQFAGGLANRNYLVVIDGKEAVLRRPPQGNLPPGAHDMAREHRIISRICDVLPIVPRGLHYCADTAAIGAPFQLIEYRSGVVVRGIDTSAVAHVPDAPVALCSMLIGVMASVHAVDTQAVGLGELGRPEGFVPRNISNWVARGHRIAGDRATLVLIEEIGDWLARQTFILRASTLLHCDLKLDNLILDPVTLAPRAVVDWDMSTRGDPLFDLATLLSYWAESGDPDCLQSLGQMPTAAPGFWTRDMFATRYAILTGREIDDLPAMRVLAMLKLSIVFLQLHRQWIDGAVTDSRYQRFRETGEGLLLHTRDIAKGIAS